MTNQRVALGDGKYCYSGPTCRLHGAQQAQAIKKRLDGLYHEYFYTPSSVEKLLALTEEIDQAHAEYDTTTPGQEELREEIKNTDNFNFIKKAQLKMRLQKAENTIKSLQDNENVYEEENPTRELSNDYDYEVPTYRTENGDTAFPATIGSKFTGYRPVTEIAKDVRKDLKEAVKGNYLPSAYGYYVKTSKYTGGQSLRVRVTGVNPDEINTRDLQNRVKTIAEAYNSSARYPQVDYFNDTYIAFVDIETPREAEYRVEQAKLKKEASARHKTQTEYVKKFKENRYREVGKIPLQPIPNTPLQTGKVEEAGLWLVRREISPGTHKDYLFDLSAYNFTDESQIPGFISRNMYRSKKFMSRNVFK